MSHVDSMVLVVLGVASSLKCLVLHPHSITPSHPHPENQRRFPQNADGEEEHKRWGRGEQSSDVSSCYGHQCPGIHVGTARPK